jgi:predicted MFS family arabinose efflux permease
MTVVGAGVSNVLPLLTAGAADTLGYSNEQVGFMSVAITVGSAAGAAFAGVWVRSVQWRRAAMLALGGMLVANLLAMAFHRYLVFILAQGVSGFFSSSVFCLGMTILSDRHQSARTFGVAGALQVAYQIAALLAGPTLLRLAGLNGVIAMLAALSGFAMVLAPVLPTHGKQRTFTPGRAVLLKPATVISLMGFLAFFLNVGAYWTYIEVMGQAQGMTSRLVANGMAMGISAGIAGGLLAWAAGDRYGRLWPIGLAAALTIVASLLVNGRFGFGGFVASGILYFFAWNYSYPYQLAIVNAVDTSGRAVAITQAFGYLGMAGGAGIAAIFVSPGNYHAVTWLVVGAACVSTALFVFSSNIHTAAAA